jgi:hypothetical protein
MNEAGANSHPISPLWPTIGGQGAVAAGWQRVLWPVGHGVWSLESGVWTEDRSRDHNLKVPSPTDPRSLNHKLRNGPFSLFSSQRTSSLFENPVFYLRISIKFSQSQFLVA